MEHIVRKLKESTAFEPRRRDRLTDLPFTWATPWCFLGQALATCQPKVQKVPLRFSSTEPKPSSVLGQALAT